MGQTFHHLQTPLSQVTLGTQDEAECPTARGALMASFPPCFPYLAMGMSLHAGVPH